ncbi:putative RNA methyltransferase At5g10620 isoform X1 [Zea mays]|uniref:Putative RNA methyltransferase n=2 Tax=Zea mays TaxID=4577 RepID=A0A1D6E047_MAIZE|nr:uncharacterized protein LOC100194016 isoform X1 [Zea mays]ONM14126.1 Putative RNA methyltransferase [Zea mays]|eukprot:XP_023157218.1 uncharacterized LOC100194016 isoform X1 [Zea mays]
MAVLLWRCICGPQQSFSKNRGASTPSPLAGRRSKYSGQSVVRSARIDLFLLHLCIWFISPEKKVHWRQKKAMPMRLLTVGKKRSRGTQLLVEEYKEKLGHYCEFEDTLIRSNPKLTSDVKVQVEAEDTAMMQQLKSDDFVVVLDENGKDVISEQIADLIGDAGNTGSSRLTFCIGGPYGLGLQVRERADATIRLSSLVLNHQVALIVLMEQLYRAWTIIKGQKYHH